LKYACAQGCKALWQGAIAHLGHIDVLVNNAGIGAIQHPVLECDFDTWSAAFDKILEVNLKGATP
jgi:NAD(P)-dependent dehydrogenase (short-subunit alcohol dehydrogenase family)